MARSFTKKLFDLGVQQSRISLVHGLPRVGRSSLVLDWSSERTDTSFKVFKPDADEVAPIVIYDHFKTVQIPDFINSFRAAEKAGKKIRYVILPDDLKCSHLLHTQLAGSTRLIEVNPLQLGDVIAGQLQRSEASASSSNTVAQAQPTNLPEFNENVTWLRGGLPESFEAESDSASVKWRRDMLSGLLDRDYIDFHLTKASNLPRLLQWAANQNSREIDETVSPFGNKQDFTSGLYVLERLGLIRRLTNFPLGSNLGFEKKPKLYIRDSGVLHAILGIETMSHLRAFKRIGDCWEGYAIEALILATRGLGSFHFFRMKNKDGEDDEIDLILDMRQKNNKLYAIECKFNPDASPSAGFYQASDLIGATDRFIVHSGSSSQLGGKVDKLNLSTAIGRVSQLL